MGVAFNILVTHIPVQDVFIELLDAHFAHIKGAAVVGLVQRLHFLFTDTPDIAKGVGKQLSIGIVTKQPGLYDHAWQTKAVDCEQSTLIFGQAKAQRHRLIRPAAVDLFVEIF